MKLAAKLALAAFALLLLAPLSDAKADTCNTLPQSGGASFESLWTYYGWQAVAAAAVLISLLIVSLAYMLGIAFRHPQITAWAKNELYQALASAFMLAFIVGFVYFLANFTSQSACLFSTTGTCDSQYHDTCDARLAAGLPCEFHIQKAWCIVSILEQKSIEQADQLLWINIRAAALAATGKYFDVSPGVGEPTYPWPGCMGIPGTCASGAFGIGFQLYAGVSMLTEALGLMFPIVFTWITSFMAQATFLALTRDAFFPIFLTMGLILRTLFFTRKLGGLLIAIAIGIYTIYPFMYIILEDSYSFDPWYDQYGITGSVDCLCNGKWPVASYDEKIHCPVRWCSATFVETVLWGKAVAFDIGVEPPTDLSIGGLVGYGTTGNPHPADFLFPLCQKLGELMVPALVIPLISILVTIAFIKGLSPLLGGDVEIAGLTHLI